MNFKNSVMCFRKLNIRKETRHHQFSAIGMAFMGKYLMSYPSLRYYFKPGSQNKKLLNCPKTPQTYKHIIL
jgi:hypothetical protein